MNTAYAIIRLVNGRMMGEITIHDDVLPESAKQLINHNWYTSKSCKIRGGGIATTLNATSEHPAKTPYQAIYIALPYPVVDYMDVIDLTPSE